MHVLHRLCPPLNWTKRLRKSTNNYGIGLKTPTLRCFSHDQKLRNEIELFTLSEGKETDEKHLCDVDEYQKPKPNTCFVWFSVWLADGSRLFPSTNQTAKQTQNQSNRVFTFDSHSKTALCTYHHFITCVHQNLHLLTSNFSLNEALTIEARVSGRLWSGRAVNISCMVHRKQNLKQG